MNIFTPFGISLSFSLSVFIFTLAIAVGYEMRRRAQMRLRLLRTIDSERFAQGVESYSFGGEFSHKINSEIKLMRPFSPTPQSLLRTYATRLSRAGRYERRDLELFLFFKASLLTLGLLSATLVGIGHSFGRAFILVLLSIFLFFIPDLWLYDRGVNRSEEIERQLPEAIDLMYLCVSAGLGVNAALEMVALNQRGPAAEELTRVLNEITLGGNRPDAFRAMNARTNNSNLREFSEMIIKVDQLGIPLKTIFEELAKLMREKRLARVRSKAQQVQVKILAPLVLCFLPSIFIVVLGPAVTSIFGIFE